MIVALADLTIAVGVATAGALSLLAGLVAVWLDHRQER